MLTSKYYMLKRADQANLLMAHQPSRMCYGTSETKVVM